jgi:hypothetical protein
MTNEQIIQEEEKSCDALEGLQQKFVSISAKVNNYIQKNGNSNKLKRKSARCHKKIEAIASK